MITKSEIKTTLKGFMVAIATWLIAIPLADKIVKLSPLKDTFYLGIIILIVLWMWD